jgi:hypothetical protein
MNKLLIGGLAVIALALTGCTTTVEPAATVAPSPQIVTPEPETNSFNPSESADYMFVYMMEAVDTPSYFLKGDLLDALQEQAISTCGYIAQGMTSDEITVALVQAIVGSDANQEVKDAFMAATVASVYSYCPQYKGFWE